MNSFFHRAGRAAGATGLSLLSYCYIKAAFDTYKSHVKFTERSKEYEKKGLPPLVTSTAWERFLVTFFPYLPTGNNNSKTLNSKDEFITDQVSEQKELKPK